MVHGLHLFIGVPIIYHKNSETHIQPKYIILENSSQNKVND